MGFDPVAGRDHFARGLGVERFVGIGDGATPQAGKEGQRCQQQQGERDAMHGFDILPDSFPGLPAFSVCDAAEEHRSHPITPDN